MQENRAPLPPDELLDILSVLRLNLPALIKQETPQVGKSALRAYLQEIQTKATKEDCYFWLGRLLAHFPRRDATKDGNILADLTAVMQEMEISAAAICETCREMWMKSNTDNPFWPPSGEIAESARLKTWYFKHMLVKIEA